MNRQGIALALVLGIAAVACKDKQEPTAPSPTPTQAATTPPASNNAAPAPATAAAAVVPAAGNMAHCPSSVAGAKTDIKDVPTGVEITITAKDDAAAKEIRARSAFLERSAKNDAAGVHHNGSGEGGGAFGRCPVVMRDTKLAVTDVDGGSKIAVTVADAKEQDWLRREARVRNDELRKPGSEGAGAGKMAHCPSAVKGATTAIADAKDAVSVTITAKDEGSVKEIRDRAQHLADAAKKGSATPKHDGSGDGGGGLGRCPIVLKDTDVSSKEAPGGAIITVKPKKGDVKTLDKEIRDRSAKFASL